MNSSLWLFGVMVWCLDVRMFVKYLQQRHNARDGWRKKIQMISMDAALKSLRLFVDQNSKAKMQFKSNSVENRNIDHTSVVQSRPLPEWFLKLSKDYEYHRALSMNTDNPSVPLRQRDIIMTDYPSISSVPLSQKDNKVDDDSWKCPSQPHDCKVTKEVEYGSQYADKLYKDHNDDDDIPIAVNCYPSRAIGVLSMDRKVYQSESVEKVTEKLNDNGHGQPMKAFDLTSYSRLLTSNTSTSTTSKAGSRDVSLDSRCRKRPVSANSSVAVNRKRFDGKYSCDIDLGLEEDISFNKDGIYLKGNNDPDDDLKLLSKENKQHEKVPQTSRLAHGGGRGDESGGCNPCFSLSTRPSRSIPKKSSSKSSMKSTPSSVQKEKLPEQKNMYGYYSDLRKCIPMPPSISSRSSSSASGRRPSSAGTRRKSSNMSFLENMAVWEEEALHQALNPYSFAP